MSWTIRYRDDAGGFVTKFAGKTSSLRWNTREGAEAIRVQCTNAEHMETVEVTE